MHTVKQSDDPTRRGDIYTRSGKAVRSYSYYGETADRGTGEAIEYTLISQVTTERGVVQVERSGAIQSSRGPPLGTGRTNYEGGR